MNKEIHNLIENQLFQLGKPGISFQIDGPEAVSILEAIYQKGRDDSERELRASIVQQQAEEFISKAEAMKLLGKSETTLWKYNRVGLLKYAKRGGRIWYRKQDVLDILYGKNTNTV